jgi:stage II sporulation protein D
MTLLSPIHSTDWTMHSVRLRVSSAIAVGVAAVVVASCARRVVRAPVAEYRATTDTIVRVALALANPSGRVSATSQLNILDGGSGTVLATSRAGVSWVIQPEGREGINASREGGRPVRVTGVPLVLRADNSAGVVTYEGRRFRGTLVVWRTGDNLVFVNHLPVEEYLLGVVPQEIGFRRPGEEAAIAAQAVSARSFTYARVRARRRDTSRLFDLQASVSDQAYGGMDSEVQQSSTQVVATRNLVLKYSGRVVEAVYSSSCGGATADAAEVWAPEGARPYLRGVSDAAPGGGYYCDIAPMPEWRRSLAPADLVGGLDLYLRNYVDVTGRITRLDSISAGVVSPSGRITAITLSTNRGRHQVTGDRIRFVLRAAGGEVLRSTRFSFVSVSGNGAENTARLEIHGRGNGHGVGMCQWGAIGRARAGQDYGTILGTYFPGVVVEPVS